MKIVFAFKIPIKQPKISKQQAISEIGLRKLFCLVSGQEKKWSWKVTKLAESTENFRGFLMCLSFERPRHNMPDILSNFFSYQKIIDSQRDQQSVEHFSESLPGKYKEWADIWKHSENWYAQQDIFKHFFH